MLMVFLNCKLTSHYYDESLMEVALSSQPRPLTIATAGGGFCFFKQNYQSHGTGNFLIETHCYFFLSSFSSITSPSTGSSFFDSPSSEAGASSLSAVS